MPKMMTVEQVENKTGKKGPWALITVEGWQKPDNVFGAFAKILLEHGPGQYQYEKVKDEETGYWHYKSLQWADDGKKSTETITYHSDPLKQSAIHISVAAEQATALATAWLQKMEGVDSNELGAVWAGLYDTVAGAMAKSYAGAKNGKEPEKKPEPQANADASFDPAELEAGA